MSLEALLCQTVTLAHRLSIGKDGRATYGPAVAYDARVEHKSKMIRGKDGVDRASTARVFLDGAVPVLVTDQLTLPSGERPEIIDIEQMPDRYGDVAYKVVLV